MLTVIHGYHYYLPDKMLEEELENCVIGSGKSLQQLLDLQQSHVTIRHESYVFKITHVLLEQFNKTGSRYY